MHDYAQRIAIRGIQAANVVEIARNFYDSPDTPDAICQDIIWVMSANLHAIHGTAFEALLLASPRLCMEVLTHKASAQCQGSGCDICPSPDPPRSLDSWGQRNH